jgi:hypothetical protein
MRPMPQGCKQVIARFVPLNRTTCAESEAPSRKKGGGKRRWIGYQSAVLSAGKQLA